jgi:hypothetical protein
LRSTDPFGGRETGSLVTLERPEGMRFLVFATPERDARRLADTFHQMLRSVRIRR